MEVHPVCLPIHSDENKNQPDLKPIPGSNSNTMAIDPNIIAVNQTEPTTSSAPKLSPTADEFEPYTATGQDPATSQDPAIIQEPASQESQLSASAPMFTPDSYNEEDFLPEEDLLPTDLMDAMANPRETVKEILERLGHGAPAPPDPTYALEQHNRESHKDPLTSILNYAKKDRENRDARQKATEEAAKIIQDALIIEFERLLSAAQDEIERLKDPFSETELGKAEAKVKEQEAEMKEMAREKDLHKNAYHQLQVGELKELREINNTLTQWANFKLPERYRTRVDGPTAPLSTAVDAVITSHRKENAKLRIEKETLREELRTIRSGEFRSEVVTTATEEVARLREVLRTIERQRDEAENDVAELRPLRCEATELKRQLRKAFLSEIVKGAQLFQERAHNKRLTEQNEERKEQVNDHKKQNGELQTRVDELQTKNGELKKQVKDHKKQNGKLRKKVKDLESQQEEANRQAFEAMKERDQANTARDEAEKNYGNLLLERLSRASQLTPESQESPPAPIRFESSVTEDGQAHRFSEGMPTRRFTMPLEGALSPAERLQPTGRDEICP